MQEVKDNENVGRHESVNDSDDILYVYDENEADDEDSAEMDDSSFNYSQIPDGIEDEEDGKQTDGASESSVFKLLLMLLINPVQGWKAVRREKLTAERAQRNCFYPLLAIMAISNFAEMFYSTRVTLPEVIISAVTNFVGYFAGYFLIIILLKLLLPKESGKSMDTEFGKVFVIMTLSSLCVFFTSIELFPMLWPILIFLPLWTVYVICKGTRFFKFPEDKTIYCTTLLCLLIVGVPAAIKWLLNEVLPAN